MDFRSVSVLIPVFNERYFIEQLIQQVLDAPLPTEMSRELIIVDDCSEDGTWEILGRLQASKPGSLRLFRHENNQGKGAAIQTAIQHATGDICLIQDADLEYDPRDYESLLLPIINGDADVVYGSRFLSSEYRRVHFFWHAFGNWFLTVVSNIFTDLVLTDMETCYKAVKSSILKSIPLRSHRFNIEPELTAKFSKRGCRIYEVPISYRGRSQDEGKKIKWRDGFEALWTIIYFWLVDDIYTEHHGRAALYSLSQTHRARKWVAETVSPWVGENVWEINAGLGSITMKLLPRSSYTLSDSDPLNVEYLQSRFGAYDWMDVKEIDPEKNEAPDPVRRVDTVLCLNVLELLEDDRQALTNIHQALMPGGTTIILASQGQWLYGSLDRVLQFRRRYSRKTLQTACEEVGFRVERLFSMNRIGLIAWLINGKIFRRRRFGKLQLKFFDSFVWLWRILDYMLPIPGLSIVAIVRRPDPS